MPSRRGAALHPERWDFVPWKLGPELESCSWHRCRMWAAQPGMLPGVLGCAQAPERFWGVPKPRWVRMDRVFAPFHTPCPALYQMLGCGAWDWRRQTAPRARCRDSFADQNIWAQARTALPPSPPPRAPPVSPHHLVLSLALPAEGQIALGNHEQKPWSFAKWDKKKKKGRGWGCLNAG